MKEIKKDGLLSQAQIAQQLQVSQATITRLIKKNGIKPIKIEGRAKLFSEEQVQTVQSFIFHRNEKHSLNTENTIISSYFQQEISKLHEQNSKLEKQYIEQLKAKDKQIDDLNERLKEAHQLQLGLEQQLKMLPDASERAILDGETGDYTDYKKKEKSSSDKLRSSNRTTSHPWWHFW